MDAGRGGLIGVGALPDSSCFNLISNWCNCVKTDFREDLSVFVRSAYRGDHLEEILNFVAEGGGLLVGGHAWYWSQTHPGQNTMTEFVGKQHRPCGWRCMVEVQQAVRVTHFFFCL